MSPEEISSFLVTGGFYLQLPFIKDAVQKNSLTPLFAKLGSTDLSIENTPTSSKLIMIEEILNNTLKNEVKKILSGYPFTIGTVLSYFILKSGEIHKIRTILNGINYGMESERIKDMI